MPTVSITRLRVRSWRFLPVFFLYALRSARLAAKAEGNLAAKLLRDRRNTFWTGTVWTNDAAMKSFMLSGIHRQAVPKLLNWCDEAGLVHWSQEGTGLPAWADACLRLEKEDRPSEIYHPSPGHLAHKFPEPRVRATAEFRLK